MTVNGDKTSLFVHVFIRKKENMIYIRLNTTMNIVRRVPAMSVSIIILNYSILFILLYYLFDCNLNLYYTKNLDKIN